jgi:LysR family transcriptional regulator, flagellar master operon regulator
MDIDIARTFLEVVKTGSFVGAASNLNITQTAVSARIRLLEQQLARPVFVRNKAGARLTPAGTQFLRFATTLVQVWERARRSVALPPGREMVISLGAELSLWNPLLRHWLLWMRRECADLAVNVQVCTSEQLMEEVQDGTLDAAVLYAAPPRPGVVSELLFAEKLVLVRTTGPRETDDYVRVDWGPEFAASHQLAFPEQSNPAVSISHGPLALEYLFATGGSGYFRLGFVRPYLEAERVALVSNAPEFSYSAYVVHSTKADEGVTARIRAGLRGAVAAMQADAQ